MKLFIQVCFTITLLMFLGISAKAGTNGCSTNSDCDDGLFCTRASFCVEDECRLGGLLPCAASQDGCVIFGSCDEVNDTCPGVPNNGLCEEGEICDADSRECITPTPTPSPPPSGPTVIIPTMGQWGMIFATLILGFYAVIRLRNRKDSEN